MPHTVGLSISIKTKAFQVDHKHTSTTNIEEKAISITVLIIK